MMRSISKRKTETKNVRSNKENKSTTMSMSLLNPIKDITNPKKLITDVVN